MHTSVENRFSYGLILKSSNALFVYCLARTNSHAKRGARGPHARQAAHHATSLSFKFFSRAEKIQKKIVRNDEKKKNKNKKTWSGFLQFSLNSVSRIPYLPSVKDFSHQVSRFPGLKDRTKLCLNRL